MGMSYWSQGQRIALAVIPKFSSFLSFSGSLWIIVHVLCGRSTSGTNGAGRRGGVDGKRRRRRRQPQPSPPPERSQRQPPRVVGQAQEQQGPRRRECSYQRLVLAMALYDALESIWNFASTWPIPADTPAVYGAAGTRETCIAQGFFLQLGVAVPVYNACLSLYCLLAMNYNATDDTLRKRVEPAMHCCCFVFAAGTAVACIFLDQYNSADLWCWIAPFPANCEQQQHQQQGSTGAGDNTTTDNECIRGKNAWIYRWAFYFAPLWFCIVFAVTAMTAVYVNIRQIDRRSMAYRHPESKFGTSNMEESAAVGAAAAASSSVVVPPPPPCRRQSYPGSLLQSSCQLRSGGTSHHCRRNSISVFASYLMNGNGNSNGSGENATTNTAVVDDHRNDDGRTTTMTATTTTAATAATTTTRSSVMTSVIFSRNEEGKEVNCSENHDDYADMGTTTEMVATPAAEASDSTGYFPSLMAGWSVSGWMRPTTTTTTTTTMTTRGGRGRGRRGRGRGRRQRHYGSGGGGGGGGGSGDDDHKRDNNPNSMEFFHQAVWYLGAFLLTHFWSTTNRIVQQATGKTYYPIILLHSIFDPLQGFLNFVVYRRPRYVRYQRTHPDATRFDAIHAVLRVK